MNFVLMDSLGYASFSICECVLGLRVDSNGEVIPLEYNDIMQEQEVIAGKSLFS